MTKTRITTTTKTTVETTLVLSRKELIGALSPTLESIGHSTKDVLRVYIDVPGGGDFSNMDLDLDTLVIVLKKESKS